MSSIKYNSRLVAVNMEPWRKYGSSKTDDSRTPEQKAFDLGILAASEFVRRYTKDEDLAYQIHALLTFIITP